VRPAAIPSVRAAAALVALVALAACGGEDREPVPVPFGPSVTLNPASVALTVGLSTSVGLELRGGATALTRVRWTSLAPGIAAVDSTPRTGAAAGEPVAVRGVTAGTTVLTVTVTHAGQTITGHVPVTVTAAMCQLSGPSLRPALVELTPGDTARIRYGAPPCSPPGDTLATWAALDTLVAVVDSTGLVTARRAGATTIRVSPRGAPAVFVTATVNVRPAS
jgi:hypothetical protein